MTISFHVVLFLIAVALAFDFLNGFHDAANSIATIVSTGAMSPRWAVMWAAFFNFVAFLVFGVAVASTIGKGIIHPDIIDHYVVFGALSGAIAWNLITWYYGIPSSSSHALVGGLVGAGIAKGGSATLVASGILKTAAAIVLSPLLGFALAIVLMIAVSWIFVRSTPKRVDRWFQRLQFVSAALYSLGHGGNDAQKTMGIIWMLLIASSLISAEEPLPFWVVLACQAAMGLGTLFGGWRIVKTMGMRITKLKPVGGFCASASGAMMLFLATGLGIPVSTTHTITGSIIGVGSARKLSAVRWGVAGNIVWAWVFTIPGSAFIAGVAWWLGTHYF
ncbi:MAG TPA: anion permease [Burkholderiales bacterium]|nr:anion permease [Burkholderiales bacterium]